MLTFAFGYFYAKSSIFGPELLAVNVILLQYVNWMSYAIDGFAFAAESVVGKYFGAGDKQKFFTSVRLSFVWALAAALLPDPDLLFLDEPFEGVDAITSRVIRDTLVSYVSRGSTVFLTSHVLDIVERLCSHVGIIAEGKLVEQSSLKELQQGSSLEDRFLEKVGSTEDAHQRLSWLEGRIPGQESASVELNGPVGDDEENSS